MGVAGGGEAQRGRRSKKFDDPWSPAGKFVRFFVRFFPPFVRFFSRFVRFCSYLPMLTFPEKSPGNVNKPDFSPVFRPVIRPEKNRTKNRTKSILHFPPFSGEKSGNVNKPDFSPVFRPVIRPEIFSFLQLNFGKSDAYTLHVHVLCTCTIHRPIFDIHAYIVVNILHVQTHHGVIFSVLHVQTYRGEI